jgi:hypothetical protein
LHKSRRRIWARPGSADQVLYFERLGFTPTRVDGAPALMADLDKVLN